MRVVGLFPGFDRRGGIGVSGAIAADVLRNLYPQLEVICYGSDEGVEGKVRKVDSKLAAIRNAIALRPAAAIICWHLGMLKLLPFVATKSTRTIAFLHGIEAWRTHDLFTRRLLRRVDDFLTNSAFTWERFAATHPALAPAAHEVVPLGLLEPAGTTRPPQSPPVAVMVGRMESGESYKGHAEVIDAWPLVVERIPAAQLWIVGGGDLRERLQRAASGSVRFLGAVSEPEKQHALEVARAFILPSRGEGFGLVYAEAMRLGRPCLVSRNDAGMEVVNPPEGGIAVDPSSREELAAGIVRLLADDREWQALSERARRRYESRYTEIAFRERFAAAINSALGSH